MWTVLIEAGRKSVLATFFWFTFSLCFIFYQKYPCGVNDQTRRSDLGLLHVCLGPIYETLGRPPLKILVNM